MPSIVNNNFRIYAAEKFIEGLFETELSKNNLFLWIGKITPWSNESSPDAVNDTVSSRIASFTDMIAMKKISPSDCSLVVPRHNWTSGTIYSQYSNLGAIASGTYYDLFEPLTAVNPFYVLTTDFNVYKCLSNASGGISSVKPTGRATIPITTSDDYIWKFMYHLSDVQQQKFLNTNWMPVSSVTFNDGSDQYAVQQTAVSGEIDEINVVNPGSGFLVPPAVVVTGDGSGCTAICTIGSIGNVTQIIVLTRGKNYTNAVITFTDGDGVPINSSYTYYVDPIHGNDSNPGTSYNLASLTTTFADGVTLTGSQSVGYLYAGTWYLYRSLDMTADEAQLAASLVDATADNF